MKAILLTGHGGPESREDVPVPRPAAGEVLIAAGAAAVNNTDIWTREGAYNTLPGRSEAVGWRGVPLSFPRIQGAVVSPVGARVLIWGIEPPARIGYIPWGRFSGLQGSDDNGPVAYRGHRGGHTECRIKSMARSATNRSQ